MAMEKKDALISDLLIHSLDIYLVSIVYSVLYSQSWVKSGQNIRRARPKGTDFSLTSSEEASWRR